MSFKFLAFPIFLASLASGSCFAEVIQFTTSEPEDKHLGMKIDSYGRGFIKRITVDKSRYLLVDQTLTDIKITKDAKTNLNHFNAFVAYNLYMNGLKKSPTRFIYVQCPITHENYVDRSPPFRDTVIDGEIVSFKTLDVHTLKKELIDPGFYKFLSSSKEKVTPLSTDFPMTGKVSEHFDLEKMCVQINIIYAYYSLAEENRKILLKDFGILE